MAAAAFVTGGSGVIGGHLIERLVREGPTVRALARSNASAARVAELGAEAVRGDLHSMDAIRALAGVRLPRRGRGSGLGAPRGLRPRERHRDGQRAARLPTLRLTSTPPLSRMPLWLASHECTIDISKGRSELSYEPVISREQGLAELAAAG